MQNEPYEQEIVIDVDGEPNYVNLSIDPADCFGLYDAETDTVLPLTADEMEGLTC